MMKSACNENFFMNRRKLTNSYMILLIQDWASQEKIKKKEKKE
jgi:hypothetical protein